MNKICEVSEMEEVRISVKIKLSALWGALMFLYIYADILSLYRPGKLEAALAGRMGPFSVTQGSLFTAALLMLIPAVMVFGSLALKPRVGRWVNIVLGVLYTAVNVSNLVGETWAFYILFGLAEVALTLLIAWTAWQWRNPEGQP